MQVKNAGLQPWFLSVIYGSPSHSLRRFLWEDLNQTSTPHAAPWIIVGDFNSVTCMELVSNDRILDQQRCSTFTTWNFDNRLIDLRAMGPKFTWNRGKSSSTFKGASLDRVLCNTDWQAVFPYTSVTSIPKLNSDHCLILIRCNREEAIRPQPQFRFQASWLTHPGFRQS